MNTVEDMSKDMKLMFKNARFALVFDLFMSNLVVFCLTVVIVGSVVEKQVHYYFPLSAALLAFVIPEVLRRANASCKNYFVTKRMHEWYENLDYISQYEFSQTAMDGKSLPEEMAEGIFTKKKETDEMPH